MYYTKLDKFHIWFPLPEVHEYKKEKKGKQNAVADGVKFAFKTKIITFYWLIVYLQRQGRQQGIQDIASEY